MFSNAYKWGVLKIDVHVMFYASLTREASGMKQHKPWICTYFKHGLQATSLQINASLCSIVI